MKNPTIIAFSVCLALGLASCGSNTSALDSASSSPANENPTASASNPTTTLERPASTEKSKQWVEVFRANVSQNDKENRIETKTFNLDGTARIRYEVTGEPNRSDNQGRAADIMFQDVDQHTESSYMDTIIDVDEPGEGTYDLGRRNGEFFLILNARGGTSQPEELGGIPEDGWSDVNVTVIVEQLT